MSSFGLSLEGQLGYAVGALPFVVLTTTVTPGSLGHHGPFLAARVGYERGLFSFTLRGLAAPFAVNTSVASLSLNQYAGGLEIAAGRLELFGLRFGVLLDYELMASNASGPKVSAGLLTNRLGLGIRASLPEPPPPAPVDWTTIAQKPEGPAIVPEVHTPTGPGSIRGTVKFEKPEGPAPGIKIEVAGVPPVTSGADGSFLVARAGPGPVSVKVNAPGFKPIDEVVSVPPEAEATLELVLKSSGPRTPATLRGLIRSAAGAPVRAQVKIPEAKINIVAGADGRFQITLPGGKYTVVIEAAGYVSQTKGVDVADGDQAIFHCDLQPRVQ